MKEEWCHRVALAVVFLAVLFTASAAGAQYWVSFADHTRYMALGDSLSAGYVAHPATQGFVYGLYQSGVIDNVNHTLFCNAGVPGALSQDVLDYQVPQVGRFFSETHTPYRQVITLTVGGNDLLQIVGSTDSDKVFEVLTTFGKNLGAILGTLINASPEAQIYVANQYDPQLGVPDEAKLIAVVNEVIAGVVQQFHPAATLVDIFSAFDGRSGLLLVEKHGADQFQVHPTNAGNKVMEKVFADAIRGH
jgi:lysophospholipase L1-like esterase